MNYCCIAAWHGRNQSVALLRFYESPGCSDSGLQFFCVVVSGVLHLPRHNLGQASLLVNQTEQQSSPFLSLFQVRRLWHVSSSRVAWHKECDSWSPCSGYVGAWWLLKHWLQLQSTPCESPSKFLDGLRFTILPRLQLSLVLVYLFYHIFPSIQLSINVLGYITLNSQLI